MRLGVSFLTELLDSLLHTLLSLSPSEYQLAEEITVICVLTACHSDKHINDDSCKRLSAFLFCECSAVIMLGDTTLNLAASIILMGRLFEMCSSCQTHLPFESLPADFAHQLLLQVKEPTVLHPSLHALLEHTLSARPQGQSKKLLRAASSILRTPRDVDADRIFMAVVAHVLDTDPDALLEFEAFVVVLKTAFMSSFLDLRKAAAHIIVIISDKPSHLKRLEEASIFEYIVESLRITESSGSDLKFLLYSITALSALAQKQASQKWVYSLDVVLSVAPYLGSSVHELRPVVCAALQNAPVPLFSSSLIDSVVSFTIQMLTHEREAVSVIESLTSLLERLRPNVKSLHSVIGIVEITMISREYAKCSLALVNVLGQHFISMAMQADSAVMREDAIGAGRRLCSIAFKTWGPDENDVMEFVEVSKSENPYPCNVIISVMMMRTTMMDETFVRIGAYDIEDWSKIVLWCWQTLPPRVVFACCRHYYENVQVTESAARYCQRISAESPSDDMPSSATFQVTEQSFLDALAAPGGNNGFPGAIKLVLRSVELDLLENICQPELVLEALQRLLAVYMSSSFSQSTNDQHVNIANALKLITRVCSQYKLAFPKLEIPDLAFSQVFVSSDPFFSCEGNSLLFFSIVNANQRTFADVAAWELFADKYIKSLHLQKSLTNVEEQIVGNDVCLESAVYAITKAKDPVAIAECVVAIVGRNGRASANLTSILEKMEVFSTSCQLFRDIETELSQHDSSTGEHAQSRHGQLQLKMKAGIGQLMLLTSAAPMLDAPRCIALTRAICDVIVCGVATHHPTRTSNMLLTAALEYLVALGSHWTSENPTRRYLCQSGVADALLRILGCLGGENRMQNRLAAVACSFLKLCASALPDKYFAYRSRVIALDLLREIQWSTLLSSFPLSPDIDNAVRIAKCCEFLECIITEELLKNIRAWDRKSLTLTLTTLTITSCSIFAFARQAAVHVLMIMTRSERAKTIWDYLAVRKEIPLALNHANSDSSIHILTKGDGDRVEGTTRCGHLSSLGLV